MPLVIFQNCLKFHSPNSLWNYVKQFQNITRGIYSKINIITNHAITYTNTMHAKITKKV